MSLSSIVRRLSLLVAALVVFTFASIRPDSRVAEQRHSTASGVVASQHAIHDDPFFFD